MSQIFLCHLARCSVFLLTATALVVLLICASRLQSAAILKTFWGIVLFVSSFALIIPLRISVLQPTEPPQLIGDKEQKIPHIPSVSPVIPIPSTSSFVVTHDTFPVFPV